MLNISLASYSGKGHYLVFLAHGDERGDLFGHPDDALDGDVGHVDHTDQVVRLRGASLEGGKARAIEFF